MNQTNRLRARLERVDNKRYVQFKAAENELHKLLEFSQGGAHLSFTPHGLSHVVAVERNYDWLLSDRDVAKFNGTELFCLLFATVLHDALMIPRRAGDEGRARRDHAFAPLDYLIENEQLLSISHHEAHAISEIIKAHGVDTLSDISPRTIIGSESVDLHKLGACLSLADICHADTSRAPLIVFSYLNLDPDSVAHWRRHMQIGGITRTGSNIEVSAIAFSDEGEDAVRQYAAAIKNQLETVVPYFRSKLATIDDVVVDIKRLSSRLQQELTFRADAQAILGVLISGVYERDDVFIRELIQNSLDASYINAALASRAATPYEPMINVTAYQDRPGSTRAVRVDDNGCGMDISDVEDTILLIGGSVANHDATLDLLSETTRKSLIATFGIGLLSCLKVAERVVVTTKKRSAGGVRLEITGLAERIKASAHAGEHEGTSILVELKPEYRGKIDPRVSVSHYCRLVTQARLSIVVQTWQAHTVEADRASVMALAAAHGDALEPVNPRGYATTPIAGDGFHGWIWYAGKPGSSDDESPPLTNAEVRSAGTTVILSDGIYVGTEPSNDWLGDMLAGWNGLINFTAQTVKLSVSRDKVVQDERLARKKLEIAACASAVVATLARLTRRKQARYRAAILITRLFMASTGNARAQVLAGLDAYTVSLAPAGSSSLADIRARKPPAVYLAYPEGNVVKELTSFDGKTLYHKEDDIVTLQAGLLVQRGAVVINAERSKEELDVREATVLDTYFRAYGIAVVDLTKQRPLEGTLHSRPRPVGLSEGKGMHVKFVEISSLPGKRAWRVGSETWLNLAHPQVAGCYEALQFGDVDDEEVLLANLYVALLCARFAEVVDTLAEQVQRYA